MEETKVVTLKPIEATPSTFKDYGQVIEASPDGDEFGPHDAQLDLSKGIPRFPLPSPIFYSLIKLQFLSVHKFYIMHIENRPLKFSNITHHASVTQCLGSIGGHAWYLGVAKPSIVESDELKDNTGKKIVQSRCGHSYVPPAIDDVQIFKVSGSKFLKLNRGTWHAGPIFKEDAMDFYNLELSNTNVIDHTTHSFKKDNGVVFLIDD
ncbi:uncharacterized protein LOC107618640 isoform X1 [Arachis ipaensis]|uniref:uncharacterized protein LOC107618640 isoform X1 n=1 Tax=Arachis ipaensis TaxID=130454 RepID=UPI0007AEFFC8|nr:uncharacterized protein LOC107618640 isoform X1 [Arachis ipaensis]XP_016176238.1 uncharacterized protein LOC107618640 isoform X1 [Arachis ipaensis]XP_020966334.1 uncharacterized protein LOC107618640 isoform X1 [Arachis ipaensis]